MEIYLKGLFELWSLDCFKKTMTLPLACCAQERCLSLASILQSKFKAHDDARNVRKDSVYGEKMVFP